MAVDPTTGQSIVTPAFDQQMAAFLNPQQFGALQAQGQQLNQRGQLGQQLLQSGYTPNSGFAGALAQMVQAFAGAKMIQSSKDQMAQQYAQQMQMMAEAQKALHAQKLSDQSFTTNEDIRKATGIHAGEGDYDNANAANIAKNAGLKAGAESQANLPAQEALEKMRANATLAAASISANATKGRGYVIKDANGNEQLVMPGANGAPANVAYTAPTAGGAKPTAAQQAAIEAAKINTEQFTQKAQAAAEARQHIINYAAQITGKDPNEVAKMSHDDIAKAVGNVGLGSHLATMLPGNSGGPQAAADSAALSYAGTIRATPTDTDVKAAQALVPNPSDSMNTQAQKIKGMLGALDEVDKARTASAQTLDKLQPKGFTGSMSDPSQMPSAAMGLGQAAVPSAPNVTHVWTPDGGLQQVQ